MRITYWTYDADAHCADCARKRFGAAALADPSTVDREGNALRPAFSTDEAPPEGVYCGTCRAEIEAPR